MGGGLLNLMSYGNMNLILNGGGKEFEAKFLDINIIDTRKKIKELGGKLVHSKIKYIRFNGQ